MPMSIIEPKYPVIILPFRKAELYCCHLDGYHDDRKAKLFRMHDVETVFHKKPPDASFLVWYNLDESKMDGMMLEQIAGSILRIRSHVRRIAFVGLRGISKWRFERRLKRRLKGRGNMPRAYFSDAERAKEWLVSAWE